MRGEHSDDLPPSDMRVAIGICTFVRYYRWVSQMSHKGFQLQRACAYFLAIDKLLFGSVIPTPWDICFP